MYTIKITVMKFFSILLVLIMFSCQDSCGQESGSEAKRKMLKEQVNEEYSKNSENSKTALDKDKSVEERIAAVKNAGNIQNDSNLDKVINIISNKDENLELRMEVLKKSSGLLGSEEKGVTAVRNILSDKSEDAAMRKAALNAFKVFQFSSKYVQENKATYTETLRGLVTDSDKELQEKSIEQLSLSGDEYVQRVLIDGLNDGGKSVIDDASAIRYLSNDLHADSYEAIHQKFLRSDNTDVKIAAARSLGNYEKAQDDLARVLKDSKANENLRKACSDALKFNNKNLYIQSAKDVIINDADNESFRAYSLTDVSTTYGEQIEEDEKFTNKLEKIVEKPGAAKLKAACEKHLKKKGQ